MHTTVSLTDRILRQHASDNVATAIAALQPGDSIVARVAVRDAIPVGHKVALRRIEAGEAIVKGGTAIGRARVAIEPGSAVRPAMVANIEATGGGPWGESPVP